jgi:antitoxin component of MazEF toxin-antitoxin module
MSATSAAQGEAPEGRREVVVVPKRIGGSIALFLPAEVVQREGIREGVPVQVKVSRAETRIFGLLKREGEKHEPFDRHKEGLWPDDDED